MAEGPLIQCMLTDLVQIIICEKHMYQIKFPSELVREQ